MQGKQIVLSLSAVVPLEVVNLSVHCKAQNENQHTIAGWEAASTACRVEWWNKKTHKRPVDFPPLFPCMHEEFPATICVANVPLCWQPIHSLARHFQLALSGWELLFLFHLQCVNLTMSWTRICSASTTLIPESGPWSPAPLHSISKKTIRVVVFHCCRSSHLFYTSNVFSQSQTRVKLNHFFGLLEL